MDFADDRRISALLEEGQCELATSRRLLARSQWLLDATRELLLTYRAHRFRPLVGASDMAPDPAQGDDAQHGAHDLVARTPLSEPLAPVRPPRGMLGGLARAAKLTPERRQEIATKAAKARWERFRNGDGTGPPDPRLGGLARARLLSPERRQEIARQGAQAMRDRAKAPPHNAA